MITSNSTFNIWVTCPHPNPQARLRLFCFPYAGGGASIFRAWWQNLSADIELCPIQLPGRENRWTESPFTRLSPLLQTLASVLQPYLGLPFAFYGHSLGALVSFELARQLRRQTGLTPVHLFVSGCRAPQLPDPNPPIHQLPRLEFLAEIRRLNGTPEVVLQNNELISLLLPTLRADFAVHETHVYAREEPLACPISAFGGLQDHKASRDELAAWQEQTRSTFNLRMFPGDHFFINKAQALLRAIGNDVKMSLLGSQPGQDRQR